MPAAARLFLKATWLSVRTVSEESSTKSGDWARIASRLGDW